MSYFDTGMAKSAPACIPFGQRLFALRPYSPYVPRAVRAHVDFLRAELGAGFATAVR